MLATGNDVGVRFLCLQYFHLVKLLEGLWCSGDIWVAERAGVLSNVVEIGPGIMQASANETGDSR